MVTVGSILGDTFRFARALPSIAVWCVILLMTQMGMQATTEAQGKPWHFLADFRGVMGLIILVVVAVLNAAVFRAVLSPHDSAAFYLRLGADEARLLGLMALLWSIFVIAGVALYLVLLLISMPLGMLLGDGGATALAAGVVVLTGAGLICLAVRLSVAGPLTMVGREIAIGPAWLLTRHKFATLLGTYALLGLCVIALYLLIAWLTFAPVIPATGQSGDSQASVQVVMVQTDQMSRSPMLANIVALLNGTVFGAFFLVAFGGASAMATLQLIKAHDGEG